MPHILIIDQDMAIGSLVRESLIDDGFTVDVATNVGKGVQCIRERRPDLVLLDLMMPRLAGWQFYGWLQVKGHSDLQVIMLTAGESQDLAPEFWSGVESVPPRFDINTLIARIRRRLREAD